MEDEALGSAVQDERCDTDKVDWWPPLPLAAGTLFIGAAQVGGGSREVCEEDLTGECCDEVYWTSFILPTTLPPL